MEILNTEQFLTQTAELLEKQKKELAAKLEAQKNLTKIIPANLEENLSALKKFFPKLYDKFKEYKLNSQYEITCNENREPNIKFPDGSYFYGKNPFDECRQQVDNFLKTMSISSKFSENFDEANPFSQLHFYYKNKLYKQVRELCNRNSENTRIYKEGENNSIPMLIMLGLGLGYQLAYLYEKFTPVNIYIIEPDTDIFYLSLCVFNYTALFEYISEKHLGIKFNFTDDPELIMIDLDNYSSKYGMNIAVKTFYQHYSSPKLSDIRKILERDLSSISIKSGFFDDTLIGICHSFQNLINKTKILTNVPLDVKFTSIPTLIVGSGPSLDHNLELIKTINDKVCIIACGTALTALIKYGIKVDIYVAIERTETVLKSLLSIDDTSLFDNILCIAPDVVHPEVLKLFKHKLLGFKANEVVPSMLMYYLRNIELDHFCCLNFCNPLVANMGVFIASFLGFKDLYFVGIDNGSAGKESHSKYSFYYDQNGKLKTEAENMVLNKLPLSYPGNFIPEIKTNALFKISIRVFEDLINQYEKNINFYNSSNGAKIKGATPKHLNEVDWSKYTSFDHNALRESIESNKAENLEITEQEFKSMLKCERYNEVAEQLIQDLKLLPKDKTDAVLRLEAHFDYLNNLCKEGLIAGSRALYGSLALMYAGLLMAIYFSNNDKKEIDDIVKTITDFIIETPKYYSHTFEYDYDYITQNVKR